MYMTRLESERELGTICLIYYSPSLNITQLKSYVTGSCKLGNFPIWCHHMGHSACHSGSLVKTAGPAIPGMCILLEVRGQFFLPSSGSLLWVCFPFPKQKYFWRIWSAVETTRIAGKRKGLPASPRPDVRESSLYNPCFPHRNSCQEERLDKAGPPKVFTDWQPQMFIIYKLSLWSNAVTTNNSSGCLSIYSFILRGKADMCHIIKLFWTIYFSRKHSMNSLHDNFTPGAGMPGK